MQGTDEGIGLHVRPAVGIFLGDAFAVLHFHIPWELPGCAFAVLCGADDPHFGYLCIALFVFTGKVYANLSDLDLFDLLSSVSSYIDCWEHAIAPALITKAKNAVAARQSSRNAA